VRRARAWLPWLLAGLAGAAAAGADGDDAPATAGAKAGAGDLGRLVLTGEQREAVGIRVDAARALTSAPLIEAYGTVLDPVTLLTDASRIDSTRAAAAAATADAARLESLYHNDAQASLKALQAAQAQAVETNAQAQAAQVSFRQQWGPLASLEPASRHALIEAAGRGERLLLRADVPGMRISGALAPEALVEVDGVQVSARVLGALPRTDAQTQSAGWLLEVPRPPAGLGPGARTRVELRAAAVSGLLVPASALVYGEQGAYIYRQVQGGGTGFAFEPVAVKPVTHVGGGWLVDGLARGDQVVVQGAGVLWSLQGISSFSAAEEEHD